MRIVSIVIVAVIALSMPVGLSGQRAAGLSAQDLTKIGETTQALEKAIAAKNGKAAAALYVETGELYPPGLPVVKGRAQIEASLALLAALSNISLKNTSVEGRGDIAYVQGTFTVTLPAQGTSRPQPAGGYFLDVRRKQLDGRWLIVVQMLSPGTPASPGK